jgi:hypothetical protein
MFEPDPVQAAAEDGIRWPSGDKRGYFVPVGSDREYWDARDCRVTREVQLRGDSSSASQSVVGLVATHASADYAAGD